MDEDAVHNAHARVMNRLPGEAAIGRSVQLREHAIGVRRQLLHRIGRVEHAAAARRHGHRAEPQRGQSVGERPPARLRIFLHVVETPHAAVGGDGIETPVVCRIDDHFAHRAADVIGAHVVPAGDLAGPLGDRFVEQCALGKVEDVDAVAAVAQRLAWRRRVRQRRRGRIGQLLAESVGELVEGPWRLGQAHHFRGAEGDLADPIAVGRAHALGQRPDHTAGGTELSNRVADEGMLMNPDHPEGPGAIECDVKDRQSRVTVRPRRKGQPQGVGVDRESRSVRGSTHPSRSGSKGTNSLANAPGIWVTYTQSPTRPKLACGRGGLAQSS